MGTGKETFHGLASSMDVIEATQGPSDLTSKRPKAKAQNDNRAAATHFIRQEKVMKFRVLIAALMAVGMPLTASAVELRVLSSWDPSYPPRPKLLEIFLKNVETASKADITFKVSGPETVPAFEQLQPVSAGVFQILFTHGAYHAGQNPYLLAAEGLSGHLAKWREAGVREAIDKHYQKSGLKLIALGQSPEGTAYNIILRQPVTPAGNLAGRKIRGTQIYSGAFASLGASPVVLPPSEIYTALEKSVVDGAAWPVLGVLDYRWHEVAKYIMRPTFGTVVYPIFMNLSAWNRLTDQQIKLILDEGRKVEDMWFTEWVKLGDEEAKQLIARGAQLTDIGADKKAKLNKALPIPCSNLVRSTMRRTWANCANSQNPKDCIDDQGWRHNRAANLSFSKRLLGIS
jgi:TRAP-type transport system periplasmic protein